MTQNEKIHILEEQLEQTSKEISLLKQEYEDVKSVILLENTIISIE